MIHSSGRSCASSAIGGRCGGRARATERARLADVCAVAGECEGAAVGRERGLPAGRVAAHDPAGPRVPHERLAVCGRRDQRAAGAEQRPGPPTARAGAGSGAPMPCARFGRRGAETAAPPAPNVGGPTSPAATASAAAVRVRRRSRSCGTSSRRVTPPGHAPIRRARRVATSTRWSSDLFARRPVPTASVRPSGAKRHRLRRDRLGELDRRPARLPRPQVGEADDAGGVAGGEQAAVGAGRERPDRDVRQPQRRGPPPGCAVGRRAGARGSRRDPRA